MHLALVFLLARLPALHAACFQGSWVGEEWQPFNCTLPEPAVAYTQCLASKKLLFIGDSTTRNIFMALVGHLQVEAHHRPCKLTMGWGCYDCVKGCRIVVEKHKAGYVDIWAKSPMGAQHTFTWKPEMFSFDDIQFLETFASLQDRPIDAVIAHKGVHDAMNYVQVYSLMKFPEHKFMEENSVRALNLAKMLKRLYPNATHFWRDSYFNFENPEIEEMNGKLRELTNPIFSQQKFLILPGHNVTVNAANSTTGHFGHMDGLHVSSKIKDLMLQMIAEELCPASPRTPSVDTRLKPSVPDAKD